MSAVREQRDAAQFGDLERAPERAPGGGATIAIATQPVASAKSTASPALERKASADRSTITGPGASASSSGSTASAFERSISPCRRAIGTADSRSTDSTGGPDTASGTSSAAPACSTRYGRALGALVDVDGVHQRAHDRQPAPAIARVGRRPPPAPAVADDERQTPLRARASARSPQPRRCPADRRARPRSRTARRRPARAARDPRRRPRRPPARCASPRARPRADPAAPRTTVAAA